MAQAKLQAGEELLEHLLGTRINYALILLVLGLVFLVGIYAWTIQLGRGMEVTGLGDQVFWGINVANFMFFIGLSLSGSFLSALLRFIGCKWQIPLARVGEVVTLSALLSAVLMLIINMGRPDQLAILFFGLNLRSPVAWEVILITSYLFGTAIYLYILLIPDLSLFRDRLQLSGSLIRYKIYAALALGWDDTPAQQERLGFLSNVLALVVVILAAALQLVTAWIYNATFRPGWDGSILAPQLIVNGLLSSVAMVTILSAWLRNKYRLEKYFKTEEQYAMLRKMLLALLAVSGFFTFAQLLPEVYLLRDTQRNFLVFLLGQSSPFWPSFIGGTIVPLLLICRPKGGGVAQLTIASALILFGAWINKAYLFIVGTLQAPAMPFWGKAEYNPSWVEWCTTLAGMSGFFILITIFLYCLPAVTIYETARLHRASTSGPRPSLK